MSMRHLFLDPADIAETHGVTLRVNPPVRREAVIRRDRPWEAVISLFLTVFEEDGRLRLWYICRDHTNDKRLGYAESTDGVHWNKPQLGVADYGGSAANNLVELRENCGTIFSDPRARAAAERYVVVTDVSEQGVYRFTSPDGFRWKRDPRPLLPFRADTQNVTFWDERRQAYVLYLRSWDPGPGFHLRRRTVGRFELADLSRPAPVRPGGRGYDPARASSLPRIVDEIPVVMAADGQDPPNTDIYNTSAQPYPPDPRWYVAFPSYFYRWPGSIDEGELDVHFAGSRDGIHWHRYDRTPYVARGNKGDDDGGMVFMGTGMIVRGDEIWQYGASFRTTHGPGQMKVRLAEGDGTIYRYVQRVDGFASADFAAEGVLMTRPLEVSADRLLLNVNCADGPLRVALLAGDGSALAGFGPQDCVPVRADATGAPVRWRGADVRSLRGRQVRVRVQAAHAKLYSLRWQD